MVPLPICLFLCLSVYSPAEIDSKLTYPYMAIDQSSCAMSGTFAAAHFTRSTYCTTDALAGCGTSCAGAFLEAAELPSQQTAVVASLDGSRLALPHSSYWLLQDLWCIAVEQYCDWTQPDLESMWNLQRCCPCGPDETVVNFGAGATTSCMAVQWSADATPPILAGAPVNEHFPSSCRALVKISEHFIFFMRPEDRTQRNSDFGHFCGPSLLGTTAPVTEATCLFCTTKCDRALLAAAALPSHRAAVVALPDDSRLCLLYVFSHWQSHQQDSVVIQYYSRTQSSQLSGIRLRMYLDGSEGTWRLPYLSQRCSSTLQVLSCRDVTIVNPAYNVNASQIWLYFKTGVGVQITENHGVLDIEVYLPPWYHQSKLKSEEAKKDGNCQSDVGGLLGNWNGDPNDDLTSSGCKVTKPPSQVQDHTESEFKSSYEFGMSWKVTGRPFRKKFRKGPIYDPVMFGKDDYEPNMNPEKTDLGHGKLALNLNSIRAKCAGLQFCEYDYIVTGRKEIALSTRRIETVNDKTKKAVAKSAVSCGPLEKAGGVMKMPIGNNYLDGVTVRFFCQPEYFLHGSEYRTCRNGTWSPAWWAWCRKRSVEHGLVALTVIVCIILFFCVVGMPLLWCHSMNVKGRKNKLSKIDKSKSKSDENMSKHSTILPFALPGQPSPSSGLTTTRDAGSLNNAKSFGTPSFSESLPSMEHKSTPVQNGHPRETFF